VTFGEEELDTSREHLLTQVSAKYSLALSRSRISTYDTLLHGKALLVIATSDAEDLKICQTTLSIAIELFVRT
jgi:hypothetical protein